MEAYREKIEKAFFSYDSEIPKRTPEKELQ